MEQKTIEQFPEGVPNSRIMTGLFADNIKAEQGYHVLIEKGYEQADISVIMSEETKSTYFPSTLQGSEMAHESIQSAENGTILGGAIGATMGAIAGIALAISSNIIIPGLGFLIAGPLLVGLVGAGTGGLTGSIIGALMGIGFGEEKAQMYESRLKSGNILIGLHPKSEKDKEDINTAWETIGVGDISM